MTQLACITTLITCFLISNPLIPQSERIIIPFRIIGKMIVVQGQIDGQVGNIVIDTGIPNMIINHRFFNLNRYPVEHSPGYKALIGDNGHSKRIVVRLRINEFAVTTGVEVINLHAIERQKRTNILGMIGIDLFRNYEFEIDYHAEEIHLYRLDRRGQRKRQEPQALPLEVLSFDYYQHLPCITTYLNGIPLRLGLDTGAEKSLLATSIFEQRKSQFHHLHSQKVMDLHGRSVDATAAQMDGLEAAGLKISAIPVVFIPFDARYGNLNVKEIQGLLGHDFLRHFRLAINFKKQKIYLWNEKQIENMPLVIREK